MGQNHKVAFPSPTTRCQETKSFQFNLKTIITPVRGQCVIPLQHLPRRTNYCQSCGRDDRRELCSVSPLTPLFLHTIYSCVSLYYIPSSRFSAFTTVSLQNKPDVRCNHVLLVFRLAKHSQLHWSPTYTSVIRSTKQNPKDLRPVGVCKV